MKGIAEITDIKKLSGKKVRITQARSTIRKSDKQKATMSGLGLNRPGQSREHVVTPAVAGMISKVHFLVKIEVI